MNTYIAVSFSVGAPAENRTLVSALPRQRSTIELQERDECLTTFTAFCYQIQGMLSVSVRHFKPALYFVKGAATSLTEHGFGIDTTDVYAWGIYHCVLWVFGIGERNRTPCCQFWRLVPGHPELSFTYMELLASFELAFHPGRMRSPFKLQKHWYIHEYHV